MSKLVYLFIACVLVLIVVTVVNTIGVDAAKDTRFIQVSVLARGQANYGVDDHALTIPPVSPKIIEDKVHDIESDLVQTIEYTSLPARNMGPADEDNDLIPSEEEAEVHNNYGSDVDSVSGQNDNNGTSINNGTENNSTNNNNKDKNNKNKQNKDKNNNNDKDKGNGGGKDNNKIAEKSSGDGNENGNDKEKDK